MLTGFGQGSLEPVAVILSAAPLPHENHKLLDDR